MSAHTRYILRLIGPALLFTAITMATAGIAGGVFCLPSFLASATLRAEDLADLGAVCDEVLAVVPALLSFAYGLYRVLAFHPIYRQAYRKWLETTPYNGGRALPLGPIRLELRDAVSLAALTALTALSEDTSARFATTVIAMTFLAPYLLLIAGSLRIIGHTFLAYATAFTLGATFLAARWPAFTIPLALLSYFLAYEGLRRSLNAFPWRLSEAAEAFTDNLVGTARLRAALVTPEAFLASSASDRADIRPRQYGWPFGQLQPRAPLWRISMVDSVALSLLVGWFAFIVCSYVPRREWDLTPLMFSRILVITGALVRLVLYAQGHRAPLSLLGRLATGRIIIPGYDWVFAAPIAAVLAGYLFPKQLALMGLHISVYLPITIALCLLILLAMGPTLRDWRLTAPCRIVPIQISQYPIRKV